MHSLNMRQKNQRQQWQMNINLWHLDIALYLLMAALQSSKKRQMATMQYTKKRLKRKIMPLNTMPHTMTQTSRKSPTWGSKDLSLSCEN